MLINTSKGTDATASAFFIKNIREERVMSAKKAKTNVIVARRRPMIVLIPVSRCVMYSLCLENV